MANEILNIIPGLQSTALMGQSVRVAKDAFNPRMSQKQRTKSFVRGTVGTMTGIGLMGASTAMINKL
jgi:hypothetical protein